MHNTAEPQPSRAVATSAFLWSSAFGPLDLGQRPGWLQRNLEMHKAPRRRCLWGSACLSACVSPRSVITTPQPQKKKIKNNARWWCLWALVRTHQSESSICVCCTPLADRWKPQAQRWGSLFWSTLPPASFTPPSPSCPPPNTSLPFFPLPLCTHQAEIKASISQSQAPEPGCRRWKPVTTRRQISPCIWHNNTDREGKEAQMQYSYENYKAGSNVTWHCGT